MRTHLPTNMASVGVSPQVTPPPLLQRRLQREGVAASEKNRVFPQPGKRDAAGAATPAAVMAPKLFDAARTAQAALQISHQQAAEEVAAVAAAAMGAYAHGGSKGAILSLFPSSRSSRGHLGC